MITLKLPVNGLIYEETETHYKTIEYTDDWMVKFYGLYHKDYYRRISGRGELDES